MQSSDTIHFPHLPSCCPPSLFPSQHILPNAAQMDPRQRAKERERRGNREDRKERGMDYQELEKEGMRKIEEGRTRGQEDR